MRYLLDTHVLLWLLSDERRVAESVRVRLAAPGNDVFLSVASAWEIEIKRGLGKVDAPDDLPVQLRKSGIVDLPIRLTHVGALASLPAIHRDPFDRILVAQAKEEGLILVTADPQIAAYPVQTLRA